MADLNSLVEKLRMMFMSGQQINQNGVSYGPSVTRIGRTPMGFSDKIAASSGEYRGPSLHGPGQILVNPVNPDNRDIMATIAHEDLHSILHKLDPVGLDKMSKENPYYSLIASQVSKTRAGDMPSEIPAYMGAYTNAFTPEVHPTLRKLYTDYFQKQLMAADPTTAAQYAKISGMDYNKTPMRLSSEPTKISMESRR